MKLHLAFASVVLGSVRTKLALAVTLLVSIIVGFFVLSTMDIIQKSQSRQSFDNSWVEAKAMAQRFLQLTHENGELLQNAIQGSSEETAKKVLNLNSRFVAGFSGWIDPKTKVTVSPSFVKAGPDVLSQREIISSQLLYPDALMTSRLSSLPEKKLIYFRFPIENRKPLIAIVRMSTGNPRPDGMIPFAGAVMSIKNFTDEKTVAEITLFDTELGFLFSTDFATDQVQSPKIFEPVLGPRAPVKQWFEQVTSTEHNFLGAVEIQSEIMAVFRVTAADLKSRSAESLGKFSGFGFFFIIIAAILATLIGSGVQTRLEKIQAAMKKLLNGEPVEPPKVEAALQDEVDKILAQFAEVPQRINALKKQDIDRHKQESEKIITTAVQQTLIPPEKFQSQLMQIRSFYQPASEFSGDWWGFFGVGQKLCILIGDCTGKGFQSALMTAAVRACFSVMHKLAIENEEFSYSPGAMLSYANRVVFDTSSGKAAMTLFAAVVDFSKGTMAYSSAGHNPPWLFRKDKEGNFTPVSLVCRGQRLGEARNVPDYHEEVTRIGKGDLLFMYTDGLPDAISPSGERFGKMRVRRLVDEKLKEGPEVIWRALKSDLSSFCKNAKPDDDLTFACIEFLPNPTKPS